ncbi:unnamed protein product [Lactuca saligna]|uniref:Uncharacterized protein n=1 Tax=Lactuca saligna TaxID=75948 RepID=A0AA35V4C1_LACSI|nr:unnamed protein product [Lactuca saligna]
MISPDNSYASVVKWPPNGRGDWIKTHVDDILVIPSGDFIVEKRKCDCLVKVRDFYSLPNIRMLCYDEGFEDFDLRYAGGYWVMIEFKVKEACTNFMTYDGLNHWFVEKQERDRNFTPLERLVSRDIEGVPLHALSKDAFRRSLAKWGYIAHLDDYLSEDVYKNQICILTIFQGIISEDIKIKVDDLVFTIHIKEASG